VSAEKDYDWVIFTGPSQLVAKLLLNFLLSGLLIYQLCDMNASKQVGLTFEEISRVASVFVAEPQTGDFRILVFAYRES
jgi:hypothetical protein